MIDEKLAKAFARLQIEPSSTSAQAKERYHDLVAVWHPDKHTSEKQKRKAEAEMRLINSAWDIVKAHYSASHDETDPCSCHEQQTAKRPEERKPDPPQGPTEAEKEAERRSRERAEQASKEAREAAEKAAAEANAAEAARQKAAEKTFDPEQVAADEKLRWRIAAGMGIVWLGLTGFAFCATTAKGWWTDFSDKWQRDHPPEQQKVIVPPGPPGPSLEEQQKTRDEEAAKQRQQDIDATKADIERYNGSIEKAKQVILSSESFLSGSQVAVSDQIKFRADIARQNEFIARTEEDLRIAQKHLASLTGQPLPPINDGAGPALVDLEKLQKPSVQKLIVPTQTDFLQKDLIPTKKGNAWDQIVRDGMQKSSQ